MKQLVKAGLGLVLAGTILGTTLFNREDTQVQPYSEPGIRFDLHSHLPEERAEEAMNAAIGNSLNLLAVTDYRGTALFDNLSLSNSYKGKPILSSQKWEIRQHSSRLLKLTSRNGTVYLAKGQEVPSERGHILAIGIEQSISPGKSTEETLNEISSKGGLAIFAHPLAARFGGVGEQEIRRMFERGYRVPLEENAQFPKFDLPFGLLDYNGKANRLAKELNVGLVFNSDNHALYNQNQMDYGKLLHSFIPGIKSSDNILEDIYQTIRRNPGIIRPEGKYNSLSETVSWWGDAIRKQGVKRKVGGALREFMAGRKK